MHTKEIKVVKATTKNEATKTHSISFLSTRFPVERIVVYFVYTGSRRHSCQESCMTWMHSSHFKITVSRNAKQRWMRQNVSSFWLKSHLNSKMEEESTFPNIKEDSRQQMEWEGGCLISKWVVGWKRRKRIKDDNKKSGKRMKKSLAKFLWHGKWLKM